MQPHATLLPENIERLLADPAPNVHAPRGAYAVVFGATAAPLAAGAPSALRFAEGPGRRQTSSVVNILGLAVDEDRLASWVE